MKRDGPRALGTLTLPILAAAASPWTLSINSEGSSQCWLAERWGWGGGLLGGHQQAALPPSQFLQHRLAKEMEGWRDSWTNHGRFLSRSERDGAATGVDTICRHRPDPEGVGLHREEIYWELSRLTHGVTSLGHYSLDRDSLCVDGE